MKEAYLHPGAQPSHRCAGCNAVDVSLLACDDIDGNGTVSDPSQRARWVKLVDALVLGERLSITNNKMATYH